jgi:hypothetical protein
MKIHDILRVFDKLEMEVREGRDTLAFFRWQGKTILWTRVPHKRGELKGKLRHFIRQQLRLSERQFRAVVKCDIWRDEYVEILHSKGLLSPHVDPD